MGQLLSSDYDRSKYLRAEDIKQEKKFRIKAVTEEVFDKGDGKPEKKLTLWFTNDDRGLPLNKTNNRTLRGAFGDPVAGWINKVIAVFPTTGPFRGKIVPCLRLRIPPPKQATATGPQPAAPQQPVTSGNSANALAPTGNGAALAPTGIGAAAAPPAAAPVAAAAPLAAAALATALAAVDPELDSDPVKPLRDELDDEVPW